MSGTNDDIIQATSNDAASSKTYAVNKGYWKDQFINFFSCNVTSKTPEISRGYFIRTQAFKAITLSFLKSTDKMCQIINLGAGSDTLFFHLHNMNLMPQKYVEIDLYSNVQRKVTIIQRRKLLKTDKNIENVSIRDDIKFYKSQEHVAKVPQSYDPCTSHFVFENGLYHLMSFDLRNSIEELIDVLCCSPAGPKCSLTLPTLFLAECVLVYMPIEKSYALIQGISAHFTCASFLHYEQVNMEDQFGKIMIKNFRARSCELLGLDACQSLISQEQRFLSVGWKMAKAWTINQVYQAFPTDTRRRVERVELLDDLEVTNQLFNHFCLILASNDDNTYPKWNELTEPLSVIT